MPEDILRERAKHVVYCQICTYPTEYCSFGSTFTRCKEWLLNNYPQLYRELYSEERLAEATENLSLEEKEKAEKEQKKREAKQEAKESREQQKKLASKVTVKSMERNKRKHVTVITGLEQFGYADLKSLAKIFGQKFATGSSVTKNASQQSEITVQGEHIDEVLDLLLKHCPNIPKENYFDDNNKRLL